MHWCPRKGGSVACATKRKLHIRLCTGEYNSRFYVPKYYAIHFSQLGDKSAYCPTTLWQMYSPTHFCSCVPGFRLGMQVCTRNWFCPGCVLYYIDSSTYLVFIYAFSFPSLEFPRNAWISACGFDVNDDVHTLRVCSKHFRDADYHGGEKDSDERGSRLKPRAVPSLSVPNPPLSKFGEIDSKILLNVQTWQHCWLPTFLDIFQLL